MTTPDALPVAWPPVWGYAPVLMAWCICGWAVLFGEPPER